MVPVTATRIRATRRSAFAGRLGRPGGAVLRRGAASLDYVLVGGVVLPMAAFVLWIGPRIIQQVYDMMAVQIGWPFL